MATQAFTTYRTPRRRKASSSRPPISLAPSAAASAASWPSASKHRQRQQQGQRASNVLEKARKSRKSGVRQSNGSPGERRSPIVRSLEILAKQQKLPMFKRALQRISVDVNQGSSLGSALRRWPQVFDALSVAMVEAGEAGGVLEEVLKRLAKLLEDNAKLQNQIRGALGYPVTVLVIAIGVFLGMTIFLIPTFAGIFEDLGADWRLPVDGEPQRPAAPLFAVFGWRATVCCSC